MKPGVAKVALITVVAAVAMQATMALVWMNPLTTRLILTPEFGQSQKLINVWTLWEPLPRIAQMPSAPMILGYFIFTLLHVLVYARFAPLLPGRRWWAKGLSLAAGIFVFQYGYFEFFAPFNQYHEPLYLIAYELLLQGSMAVVEGLAIAGLFERLGDGERSRGFAPGGRKRPVRSSGAKGGTGRGPRARRATTRRT